MRNGAIIILTCHLKNVPFVVVYSCCVEERGARAAAAGQFLDRQD
jgi:hypothetical protein